MRAVLKNINWRKGGGELLGFAMVLPAIMLVFGAIIMAAQLGLARQSIEYTTYSAARAAVICESQSQAQQAAELLVEDMAQDIPGVEPGSVSVNIRNYMGSIWQKGGLIKCTVEAKVNTISPWSNSTVAADITIMIERPPVPYTKEEGGQ